MCTVCVCHVCVSCVCVCVCVWRGVCSPTSPTFLQHSCSAFIVTVYFRASVSGPVFHHLPSFIILSSLPDYARLTGSPSIRLQLLTSNNNKGHFKTHIPQTQDNGQPCPFSSVDTRQLKSCQCPIPMGGGHVSMSAMSAICPKKMGGWHKFWLTLADIGWHLQTSTITKMWKLINDFR